MSFHYAFRCIIGNGCAEKNPVTSDWLFLPEKVKNEKKIKKSCWLFCKCTNNVAGVYRKHINKVSLH